MNTFVKQYGPWSVITGASSGIGAQYARVLASIGLNVVIVARRKSKLNALASSITSTTAVEVKVVVADLSSSNGLSILKSETSGLEVGLLVNNAGREDSGRFLDSSLDDAKSIIALNCQAPMQLTHHFAQQMKHKRMGGIIFMSSLVAYQGVPFVSNYAGTKAYNLIFGESIGAELERHNIDVLISTPGFTATELAEDWSFADVPIKPLDPSFVARTTIKALGKKRVVVPGRINNFLYFSSKYLQTRKLSTFLFKHVFTRVLQAKLDGENDA